MPATRVMVDADRKQERPGCDRDESRGTDHGGYLEYAEDQQGHSYQDDDEAGYHIRENEEQDTYEDIHYGIEYQQSESAVPAVRHTVCQGYYA